ncbi:methyl-accepting chemotaxis protein [Brevibacillus sp. B_LB10_24]|uniref:methyl-accepting chemotaxis protein n=1 Tax=Brevibacillus sp. B_LB10_24 TaxID=3380645 RepID=UPI0038B855AF
MKFTLGKKLVSAFVIIALLLGAVGITCLYFLQKVDQSYSDILVRREHILTNLNDISNGTVQMMNSVRSFLAGANKQDAIKFEGAYQQAEELLGQTVPLLRRDTDIETVQQVQEMVKQLKEKGDKVFALPSDQQEEAVRLVIAEAVPLGLEMKKLVDEMASDQKQLIETAVESNQSLVVSLKWISLGLIAATFILAVAIGIVFSRRVSRSIGVLSLAAGKIAEGDFSGGDIRIKSRDEIGDLARSFQQMKENLRVLIRQVALNAQQVAASAEQLMASSDQTSKAAGQITLTIQEMAAGSDQQVQEVEGSAKEIQEMSTSAQHIAASAGHVSGVAAEASRKAADGDQAIRTAVEQMETINRTMSDLTRVIEGLQGRSTEIGQIIEVITSISAQTNLLALNAAIEAARAGEHGRGFSVVADEVRKLAEQSTASAQQIADLISAIQLETGAAAQSMQRGRQEVENGMGAVHQAGKSFAQIQASVLEVTNQIEEVSAASKQMAAGTEKVVQTFERVLQLAEGSASGSQSISAATQEQLASMEEITASAGALSKLAEELQQRVETFKV